MNLSAVYTRISLLKNRIMQSENGKKVALLFLVFIFIFTVFFTTGKDEKKEEDEVDTGNAITLYEESLENRLEALITNIDGVGECRVMVTLEKDDYKIFAKDSYEEDSGNKYEYVIVETESGSDDGLVVNSIMPEVRGVAVVCEGGDSAVVKSAVISAVSSVLSVSSAEISVSKMK